MQEKELKCPNCGSVDFTRDEEGYLCQYCGSRFLREAEKPKAEAESRRKEQGPDRAAPVKKKGAKGWFRHHWFSTIVTALALVILLPTSPAGDWPLMLLTLAVIAAGLFLAECLIVRLYRRL